MKASGAHVGAVLDPDGERLTLIDDEGHVLSDTECLLVFVELVSDHLLGDTIALPVKLTSRAAELANRHGVQVRSTKISVPALMDAATEPGVGFAADGEGGFILPGFLPAFDAAAAAGFALHLVEPHLNGPGGDMPAILWDARSRRVRVLCGQATPGAPRARDPGHTVGAEGHGHALPARARSQGP